MLEASSLLIHPWHVSNGAPHCWSRPVLNGATSAALGTIRWVGPPEGAWFAWLRGHRLEVLETEDAALLMTLVRPWGLSRLWDVCDAEERHVGTVYPPVLMDSEGGRRAYVDATDPTHGKVLDPTARVLAEYERMPERVTLLRFAADLEANPFLRMLIVGGVIVQEQPPVFQAKP
jgi:hypothetical protein